MPCHVMSCHIILLSCTVPCNVTKHSEHARGRGDSDGFVVERPDTPYATRHRYGSARRRPRRGKPSTHHHLRTPPRLLRTPLHTFDREPSSRHIASHPSRHHRITSRHITPSTTFERLRRRAILHRAASAASRRRADRGVAVAFRSRGVTPHHSHITTRHLHITPSSRSQPVTPVSPPAHHFPITPMAFSRHSQLTNTVTQTVTSRHSPVSCRSIKSCVTHKRGSDIPPARCCE